NIAVGRDTSGKPVLVRNVANVAVGPDIRRGVAELDGEGGTVGGIVVMRQGENALKVAQRVREKLKEVRSALPAGVEVVATYDRSDLIRRAIDTLRHQLTEEMIIVSLVIVFFLWHLPSASVPVVTIPIAVLLSFIPLFGMKLTTNIMSLAGIAISVGVLVDGAIVEVENAYRKLELWDAGGRRGHYREVLLAAIKEVAPSVFFSLLVIAAAFLPVFTLLDQEGRLFRPLAFSKNFAMAIAAVLAITLDPAVRMLFVRMDPFVFRPRWLAGVLNVFTVGKYYSEERHPVSRVLFRLYEPVCRWVLRFRWQTLAAAMVLMLATVPIYFKLGSEFMPPLNEGTLLYMPTTLPGISVGEAEKLLVNMDRVIRTVPEVERVFGKAGRADSSTDPAPLSMMETTIVLKPESEWRRVPRWYSRLPGFLQAPFRPFWRDRVTWQDIVAELDRKMQFPGVSNAWTMPIKARTDMLSTGMRTPVGVKVYGADLSVIERIGLDVEKILRKVPGTRSVYAERVGGGYFLDLNLRREALARYGLSVREAEETIASAIGGEGVTTTVEGRERYSVNVRYARDFRDDVEQLRRVLVPVASGAQVPLEELAEVRFTSGPAMLRDENGMLAGYVYVDIAGRDVGSYVADARKAVEHELATPAGYALQWSGQYENMLRVKERLKVVVPLTLALIFVLLYANTRSAIKTAIVMLAVPFSLVGAIWLLYILGYNMSIAVWVGMIALMGLDAETGVFMLLYLDISCDEARQRGALNSPDGLKEAIVHGAVKRIRPKLMTVSAMFMGLVPIMWSTGAGADVMKRIAAPMIGGVFSSFILELLVYPVLYFIWKNREAAWSRVTAGADPAASKT
ncbi:MAG: efflux RND transporter permease subunit, partial [Candidatus Omnitrophica bacterium]|nr:efflux RND transporter permease subunit [Candidatus Omnitrophota bacterium]